MPAYAVVLFNLGGPDDLDAVEPFLCNLFGDPDIFKLPFGQKYFAKWLSRSRAASAKERYRQIGGASPINRWTQLQRSMLQEELRGEIADMDVFAAMRYWRPMIPEIVRKVSARRYEKIVLLPLYPHYSITTTGSSFNEWKRRWTDDADRLVYVNAYFDHPGYIAALNERIDQAVGRLPQHLRGDAQLVFSAHGTPEKLVKKGDPYSRQIQDAVERIMEARKFSHDHHLCFQSKVGPMKWLGPSTADTIEDLARRGKKQLIIVPVSFVSDQIETLYELDIEYRREAARANIEHYIVMEGLNDSPTFIAALKDITLRALGPEPWPGAGP